MNAIAFLILLAFFWGLADNLKTGMVFAALGWLFLWCAWHMYYGLRALAGSSLLAPLLTVLCIGGSFGGDDCDE